MTYAELTAKIRNYTEVDSNVFTQSIIDGFILDSEFRISLKEDGFKELFSHGQMFFKTQDIIVIDEDNPFKVELFVMTYETLINDAESRNDTFLRILKSTIKKWNTSSDITDNSEKQLNENL